MRVLIVGASGFIGRHLVRRLGRKPDRQIVGTYLSRPPGDDAHSWLQVELTDSAGIERVFRLARPDAVVHLAAIADVGTAERDPERATAVNVTATASIARLCNLLGAKLIFVSTEYVFDGKRGYYREDESPIPTTHYGQTKWEAEQEVASLTTRWSVLRTSIVYGWPEPGQRNFAPWLLEHLKSGQTYNAPTDVYRTPVYVKHLTDGIAKLVDEEHTGIHHVAGADWVSMYDFAAAIAQAFHLDRGLVEPSGPIPTGLPGVGGQGDADGSRSPDMLGLDCAETMRLLGLAHPGLTEGIEALRTDSPHGDATATTF